MRPVALLLHVRIKRLRLGRGIATGSMGVPVVKVGGKEVPIETTRDFAPSIKDGKVIYRFTAVLPQPIDPRTEQFAAGVYDHSYYVDVEVNPQLGVKLAGGGSEACKYALVEDKDAPLYFGATFARRIEIRCDKN